MHPSNYQANILFSSKVWSPIVRGSPTYPVIFCFILVRQKLEEFFIEICSRSCRKKQSQRKCQDNKCWPQFTHLFYIRDHLGNPNYSIQGLGHGFNEHNPLRPEVIISIHGLLCIHFLFFIFFLLSCSLWKFVYRSFRTIFHFEHYFSIPALTSFYNSRWFIYNSRWFFLQ